MNIDQESDRPKLQRLPRHPRPRPGECYRLGHYRARVLECHGDLCRVACEGGHLVTASVHVSLLQ